ncbi:MAG: hypothetical protein M1275_00690 [Patescibacteria group bacterium]|nr:hypothetical protein [Patescibacteria group bacterium]
MNHGEIAAGRLVSEEGKKFLRTDRGEKKFTEAAIWDGYFIHFNNRRVLGRTLPQIDYASGRPLALLWPEPDVPPEPFLEIYYNERLPNYPGSLFGHGAINVNGRIFNFAHKLNENEELTWEEYFFRPALGEFAPGPNGKYDISDPQRPYYDKFGRRFMRAVWKLRITGISNAAWLLEHFRARLKKIKTQILKPQFPDINRYFNLFSHNCITELHAGLTAWGLKNLNRWFPLDFFFSSKREFSKLAQKQNLQILVEKLPQLKVPEAPFSKSVPAVSPRHWLAGLR